MLAALLLYKSHDNETGWSRRTGSVVVEEGGGGTLAFGRRVKKEEEDGEIGGGRERGHKENKPSGLSAPAVELSFLMRPPLPAV